MAAFTPQSGFGGTFAIGINELPCNRWNVRGSTDAAHSMCSKSGVIPIPLPTWQKYSVDVDFDCDFANPTFSGGPGIGVGVVLAAINLYQHDLPRGTLGTITTPTSNTIPGWVFANALCQAISNPVIVNGSAVVKYTMSLECYGVFQSPY
jgi:hypothetical protein